MQKFKKPDGSFHFFEDGYIGPLITEDMVIASAEEIDNHCNPAISLVDIKKSLVDKVDSGIAAIYAKWMRFEAEYTARENAARLFAAAGFTGEAGIWVTSFSASAGINIEQATQLIIAQADALRSALVELGSLRMRKYEITAASTENEALQKYNEIVTAAAVIAASLQ